MLLIIIIKQKLTFFTLFFFHHWICTILANIVQIYSEIPKKKKKNQHISMWCCVLVFYSWYLHTGMNTGLWNAGHTQSMPNQLPKLSTLLSEQFLNLTCDLLEQRDVLHFLRQRGNLLAHSGVAGRSVLQILQGFYQLLCLSQNTENNSVAFSVIT